MISLIKADLYKETRKKSLKVIIFIIVVVSFISVLVLNRIYKEETTDTIFYPLYSLEEYKEINKYGSYSKYKESYSEYKQVVNNIYKINVNKSKVINILENKESFLFFIGVIVIFIAYNSISYDYNKGTLKYIVLNKHGRKKTIISKIISVSIISILLLFTFSFTYLLFSMLKFNVNLFKTYEYIYIFKTFIKLPYLLYYFISSLVYIVPYIFIIVFTYFLVILFKGNTISLIISNIIYLFSLVISQFLLLNGINILKYSFMPYLDYTYLSSLIDLTVNNMIFNTNINIVTSIIVLVIYTIIFGILSIKIFSKRDIT